CGVLNRRRGLRKQSVELVEPSPRLVIVRHSGSMLHLADDRKERAVGVLWRAKITQPRMRLGGQPFQQRGRKPRFADAGLARKQQHLAFTGLCSRPAPQQQFALLFTPDEVGQAARMQGLEAAFYGTRP